MSEIRPVSFGLVGIGGYAGAYLLAIRAIEGDNLARLGAVVIRSRGKYPDAEKDIEQRGISIRSSLEEMLEKDRQAIEVVALPTGIASHRAQMIQSVEAGLNVLLEKPTTATIQDFDAMEDALRRTGKFCAVGFQSQSHPVVLALKRAVCAGRLGRIRDVVVTGFWRRDEDYYKRNAWGGRLKVDGEYVLDGSINNPMAHYLFNALFFASDQPGRAAMPVSVRAELYHGHQIESEDTACLDISCDNGVRVCFYGTLCASANKPIMIEVVGERGRAVWNSSGSVTFHEDGKAIEEVSEPSANASVAQFRNVARYLRGADAALNCPLEMTRAHVLAVNGAFTSAGRPATIPAKNLIIQKDANGSIFTDIAGIDDLIGRAAAERKLFSDVGVEWAKKTKTVSLQNYRHFALD